MTAIVLLSAAVVCLQGRCYPVLVGRDTPTGEFAVQHRMVLSPGYGGDVLQYKETAEAIYAIHRVWLGHPQEHRVKRLASRNPAKRRGVTGGCINVMPDVYDLLQSVDKVVIEP